MYATLDKHMGTRNWSLPNITGLGGGVAGMLAGAVTLALLPLLTWLTGVDVWNPLKVVAAQVLGPDAFAYAGFDLVPVLVGTLLYLVGAVLLGAIFGVLYRRVLNLPTAFGLPVYAGLVYGMLTCLIASVALLPDSTGGVASTASIVPLLVQQLVFAVCLGLFYTGLRPTPYQDTVAFD